MASFLECFYDIWSINITITNTFISTIVGSIATIIDPYENYNYDSYKCSYGELSPCEFRGFPCLSCESASDHIHFYSYVYSAIKYYCVQLVYITRYVQYDIQSQRRDRLNIRAQGL